MPEELARRFFEAGTVTLHGKNAVPQQIRINLSKRNNQAKNEKIAGLVREAQKKFGFDAQPMTKPNAWVLSGNSQEWNAFARAIHSEVIKANTKKTK